MWLFVMLVTVARNDKNVMVVNYNGKVQPGKRNKIIELYDNDKYCTSDSQCASGRTAYKFAKNG